MWKKATAVGGVFGENKEGREGNKGAPTMANSMGMRTRKMWNKSFIIGHSGVLMSLQVRGERTRVSQAATVTVQTMMYFWAERWGGRSSEGGSSRDIAVAGGKEERW